MKTDRPNLRRIAQELATYRNPDRTIAALGALLGASPAPNNESFTGMTDQEVINEIAATVRRYEGEAEQ